MKKLCLCRMVMIRKSET